MDGDGKGAISIKGPDMQGGDGKGAISIEGLDLQGGDVKGATSVGKSGLYASSSIIGRGIYLVAGDSACLKFD